ncbi:MAG: hypothetical protein KDD67_01010 [Ignavibacteriae bacterium]|nr:hypothetical protein [Ignavibacteriota bacterium]MCB9217699.1 hypothetical protein [Ignavibacteria bacterium]
MKNVNRNLMTTTLIALLLALGVTTTTQAQTDADATAKLKQLKRMAESVNLGALMEGKFREGVEGSMTENKGMFSDEVMAEFVENVIDRFDIDEFLETVALPVLDPYFTSDELSLVADFVETDLGQRLITSAMNGKKEDFNTLLENGEVSEEDGMKLMQFAIRFASKKSLLDNGTLGKEFETAAAAYGESIVIDVMTEMMEKYSEGAE